MKCIVENCKNHDHQGNGITFLVVDHKDERLEWICIPCWKTLKGINIEKYSQLYRNVMRATSGR
jgi:hypothetical protein